MSERREPYNAGQPNPVDEYNAEGRGEGSARLFFVYQQLGQSKLDYCECQTMDAALLIARALNIAAKIEGQNVETIPFADGELVLVVKGKQAEQAYFKALPMLQAESKREEQKPTRRGSTAKRGKVVSATAINTLCQAIETAHDNGALFFLAQALLEGGRVPTTSNELAQAMREGARWLHKGD